MLHSPRATSLFPMWLLVTLTLAGCPAPSPTGGSCLDELATSSSAALDFEIGLADTNGVFSAWGDTATASYVWGSQGAIMVQPIIRVGQELFTGDEVCVEVQVTHEDPTGANLYAAFPAFSIGLRLRREGDYFVSRPLFDPIGTADLPGGTLLRYGVTLRTTNGAASSTHTLTLGSAGYPTPPGQDCSAFAIDAGQGCHYRIFNGFAEVMEPMASEPDDATCADGRRLRYRFVTTDPTDSRCFLFPTVFQFGVMQTPSGQNPPLSCLNQPALTAGYRYPIARHEVVRGTCTPVRLVGEVPAEVTGALAACGAQCQ